MSDITAGELYARKDELEHQAATILGHMLFKFSRLDMNLGLCLVWVNDGANIGNLTETVADLNFNAKLVELSKYVEAKLPSGSKRHKAYTEWLERAHKVRQQRNELAHGRWGIEANKNKVINILGLPTSDSQRVVEYTIDELAEINEELHSLLCELSRLRECWPL